MSVTPSTPSVGTNAMPHTNTVTPDEVVQRNRLLEVATVVLEQALDLLDNFLSHDEQLTIQSKYIAGSTIGKHLRHARDHYVLLLDAMASSSPPYILNYDVRSRNTPMETSLAAARGEIAACVARLRREVPKLRLDEPLVLNAVTPYPQTLHSTFGRELWFAGLHAEHHWSMIRVQAGELGIRLPDAFGFAPSTLVHHGSDAPLGKAKI
ncbi:hypothetical protein BDW22DRAFT_1355183 [Trametopsis cervina]|nr:hypothetical protein BDW22DRAFT_1355183 [Trametopsis cervina]